MSDSETLPVKFGEGLVRRGLISADQLRIALREQRCDRQPVGRLLVRLGFMTEAMLRDEIGTRRGQRAIDLACAVVDPEGLRMVPREVAAPNRLLPLSFDKTSGCLTLAMADPSDIVAIDHVRRLLPAVTTVEALLAGESEIAGAIDRHYGHPLTIDSILSEIETGQVDARWPGGGDPYSHPVVRLVDALLADGVKRSASDIHFEPELGFLRIRHRIDGILHQTRALHSSYWSAMAVRIKVMAGLNIAETRAPQDGRMTNNINGRPLDLRVAVQPTIHGENIVVRILDRNKGLLPLDALGVAADHIDKLQQLMASPEGLTLVTGPTGSGKTTTLYSMLAQLNSEQRCIMTLEDPVEYPLPMIRQTAVAEANKLDFANGIRSMMRQDPDILLVGEIRDPDTASMAFRAAMTGHQVFSTLHTRSAVGALPRLLDLGIPADIIAGNIVGIVAQRLVRRLCPHCKTSRLANADERRLLGSSDDSPPRLHVAAGCERCDHLGYRGRLALTEVVLMNPALDELVARRASARELAHLATTQAFRPLVDDGLQRVREGTTTLTELARVVNLTDRS